MDKDSLVEQVKSIQRSDISAKQAWWDYCDKNLEGVKDPSKHDAAVLNTFVVGFTSGAIRPSPVIGRTPSSGSGKGFSKGAGGKGGVPDWMAAMASWMGGGSAPAAGGSTLNQELQDWVKFGQRHSAAMKQTWQVYCQLNGSTKFDPAKYDKAFLVGFIDYLGQVSNEDLAVAAAGQGITIEGLVSNPAGVKRPIMSADGSAAKRFAGADASGDPVKAALVDRVKALQRADENARNAWTQYCTDALNGVKDPARHDSAILQQFLDQFGG